MKYRTLIIWLMINVIVLGIGSYFYTQNQQAMEDLKIRTEGMYQQSFHSLISHIKTIENYLAKSLVATDLINQQEIMSTITRQVYSSQEELGKLPLILVPLINTETTLQKIADFAWQVNTKNLKQESSLTSPEWTTLVDLKQCTSKLLLNLQNIQSNIIENNLRWVDIELMYSRNEVADNTVIDGLHLVDKDVKAYSETQAGILPHVREPKVYYNSDQLIDERTARNEAAGYLGKLNLEVGEPVQVIQSEGDIPAYVVFFDNGVNQYTCAVTKAAGSLAWFMGDSILTGRQLTNEEAINLANEYLNRLNFQNVTLVGHNTNDNAIMLMYAGFQDDTVVYPEMLRLNVNLNTGIITGADFSEYLKYHHQRTVTEASLAESDIVDQLPKNSVINNIQKAIIFNQQGQEVLTFEVAVSIAGENYLIYLNADTGIEENIIRIESKT